MAITCECAHCTTKFWAPNNFAGKDMTCPVCQRSVRVPGGAPAPATSSPQQGRVVLEVLQEDMGIGSALTAASDWASSSAAHPQTAAAWGAGGRGVSRRRTVIRLSRRAALGVALAGVIAFYSIILFSLPKIGWLLGWLIFLGGLAVIFSGCCWHLYIALREDTSCMVWTILNPFYAFYHLVTRWDKTRKPFRVVCGGVLVCGVGYGAITLANHLMEPKRPTEDVAKEARAKSRSNSPLKPLFDSQTSPAPTSAEQPQTASEKTAAAPGAKSGDTPGKAPAKSQDDAKYEPAKDLLTPPPGAPEVKPPPQGSP